MAIKENKQTSAHIETLRFPDSIRDNPGMYMGSTDADGVWLCAREPLDNSIDEGLAGRATMVWLHVDKDGSYWVQDDAGGIPQGIKKVIININGKKITSKLPTMQAIFGELHTSGKFHSEAYKVSRGTHGVGVKGVNATSEFFDVWSWYEGKCYKLGFQRGELTTPVQQCKAPKSWDGTLLKTGTLIHYKPDHKIYSVKSFPASFAVEWANLAAHLHPGFRIILSSSKGKKEFYSKKGATEYVQQMIDKAKAEGERLMFQYKSELADVIVAFTNYEGFGVSGFVNGLSQRSGGKHVESVAGAMYAGLKPFIKTKKTRVEGKIKEVPSFRESDLKEGMIGLVNIYLHKAIYSSQDKANLKDDRAGAAFEKLLTVEALKFFKANKALALRLVERATQMNELKSKFTLSKRAAGRLNAVKRSGLPAKYAAFDTRTKISDRELFLVEGDSAGGNCKEARFPYQAVLPLKGKILNALKDKKGKTFESEEIINILAAIGYDTKATDPYAKLTVGKIICLADPDPDGPFVGDTKIMCRPVAPPDGVEGKLHEIASLAEARVGFEVPVWTGARALWAPATARLEANVDTLVALEIAGCKYKVSEGHKFLCVVTPSMYGRKHSESNFKDMIYVQAKDLKIGDRVFMPANNGSKNSGQADKINKIGFAPVSKLRVQKLKDPVPVYCLTVPGHHNFILPSGVVSSNCHINSLLLTLFYRYLPDLFTRGMIYVSDAPEFYAISKGNLVTGDTLSSIQKKLKKLGAVASTNINHVKGYGELDTDLVRIMAMDPSTRKIIKIKAIEAQDKVDFIRLMNDDVEYRRDMLGLPKNAKGGSADGETGEKPARKVASKKTTLSSLKKIVQRRDSIESKRIAAKKGVIRLGPLSDAIKKVAAAKRRKQLEA